MINKGNIKFIVAGVIIFVILVRKHLGTIAVYTFSRIDSLNFSNQMSPTIIWAILGTLIGAVYGGYVAYKKYNLAFKHVLLPMGVLVLVVSLLAMNTIFIKANEYDQDISVIDTTVIDTVVVKPAPIKRRKQKKREIKNVAALDTIAQLPELSSLKDSTIRDSILQ